MPYATIEDYQSLSISNPKIENDYLPNYLEMASDDIDRLTYGRIKSIKLTEFQKEKIKKATILQADYLFQFGDMFDIPIDSFNAGNTSVNLKDMTINGVHTTLKVKNYVDETGLTCTSIYGW